MHAKKSLGQHFLHDESALLAIRDAVDPTPLDVVLEIGPGKGALTEHLKLFVGKLVAVEKDDELVVQLREKYAKEMKNGRIEIIHGDILDFDPEVLRFYKDFSYKLAGNIPYNITGAILRKFLSASYQPELAVFLVQKEVAERIVAKKTRPFDSAQGKESILSISIKAYGKPKIVKIVKAGSFNPSPQVDSAILLIEDISKDFFGSENGRISEERFFELVKAGFHSKRKKLSSNLSTVADKNKVNEAFMALNMDENTRAEDVSIEMWKKITERLS